MTLYVMGIETVPDALGILPTVALTLKVVGVEIVPDVLGVLPIVALTLEVVGAVTRKPIAAVVIGFLIFSVVKRLDTRVRDLRKPRVTV